MTYKENKERRAEDLQKLINITKEPLKVTEMANRLGRSRTHVALILKANPQHFKNLGLSKDQYPSYLYQRADLIDTKSILASTVYKLQDSPLYHASMKVLRDNRTRLKTFVSGSTLA